MRLHAFRLPRAFLPCIIALFAGLPVSAPVFAQSDAPDWASAQEIDITMTNFAYTPDTLTLKAGTPYRLHFINNGDSGHDFTSDDFLANATLDPEDKTRLDDGSLEVDKAGTADLRVVPVKAGTYAFHCSHFMHSTFGMTGKIIVQ